MTKQEIIRDIKSTFGPAGFINMRDIAKYTRRHSNDVQRYMAGYPYQRHGRKGKFFFVGDVAERMLKDLEVRT